MTPQPSRPGVATGSSTRGSQTTPGEEIVLVQLGLIAIGTVIGSAGLIWLAGARWLVAHRILVAGSAEPLITIPGTDGAGLDLPRVCIAAAVLLAALAIGISRIRRMIIARRAEAML